MEIPDSAEATPVSLIDASEPFKNIVVCCTAIPQEGRSIIADRVAELGGVHKYDLTPDVTHLIVGDYDTPKYRHVARERPDIKAMDAAWLESVTEIWKTGDDDFDFTALEARHVLKTFESRGSMPLQFAGDQDRRQRQPLLICLTGFGDAREGIAERIDTNGGRYTGDLTRKCTHLVVHAPEGKKFTAAKNWGIKTVTLGWLEQSLERGMILEEDKFDPLLPIEEQGLGAWVRKNPGSPLGKRSRSGPADSRGPRKLRKTASMKLQSQSDGLWGDILGQSTSKTDSFSESKKEEAAVEKKAAPESKEAKPEKPAAQTQGDQGQIFTNCTFYIHGFTAARHKVLADIITSLNGSLTDTVTSLAQTTNAANRFLIVPQASQPDSHPQEQPDNIHIVTEFYIEKCLHNKHLFDPNDHVLGRPFPAFPVEGLKGMAICTAAFTGIELSQVARAVAQLGATFTEEFRQNVDVLVCRSLSATRKEKLKYALSWNVPVVSADWLWECISTGCRVPVEDFTFSQLKRRRSSGEQLQQPSRRSQERSGQPPLPPTAVPAAAPLKSRPVGVDSSGFDAEPAPSRTGMRRNPTTSADFQTAQTHPRHQSVASGPALTELSAASLNQTSMQRTASVPLPSSTKQPPARAPSAPTSISEDLQSAKKPHPRDAILEFQRIHNLDGTAHPNNRENDPAKEATEAVQPPPKEEAVRREKGAKEAESQDLAKREAAAAKVAAHHQERLAIDSKLDSLLTRSLPSPASPQPKKRGRKVFGRALSGASATSSNDHLLHAEQQPQQDGDDDGAAAVAAKEIYQPDEDSQEGSTRGGKKEEEGFTGTQIGYADPDAQVAKRMLMRKMTGEGSVEEVKSRGSASHGLAAGAARSLRNRS